MQFRQSSFPINQLGKQFVIDVLLRCLGGTDIAILVLVSLSLNKPLSAKVRTSQISSICSPITRGLLVVKLCLKYE